MQLPFLATLALTLPPLALASPHRLRLSDAKRTTSSANGSTTAQGPTPFLGTGKIGLYHDESGAYMGCSTSNGSWTVDSAQCGTFVGTVIGSYHHVSTSDGQTCGTTNLPNTTGVFWNCGRGEKSDFWTYDLGFGTRLILGDFYMSYAHGEAVYPAGTEALSIHLWESGDSGKFVQLGWNATTS